MGLANAWGLLALAAIPLVVYLHRRASARRIAVPLVSLWSPGARPARTGPRRMRLDAILVVRLLLVIAVALALAEPRWTTRAPGRHVLVVDASARMLARETGGTRFARAIDVGIQTLGSLPAGDAVAIVRASASPALAHPFSRERGALEATLRGLAAGESRPSLEAGLAEAVRVLGPETGIVHVVSDARDAGWLAETATRLGLPREALRLHTVGGPAANAGIVAFEAAPASGSPLDLEVVAAVENFADAPRAVDVALHVPGGLRERRRLALAARAREVAVFVTPHARWLEVRLDGEADALAADDRAVLTVPEPTVQVLHASRGDRYVRAALRAHPGLTVREVPAERLLAETRRPLAERVAVVEGAVPDEFPLPALVFGSPAHGSSEARVPLADWHSGHPLLRQVDLASLVVPARAALPVSTARSLARTDTGSVLSVRDDGGPRRVEFAFAVERSSLGTLAAFPVVVARALAWLAPEDGTAVNVRAGAPVRIPWPGPDGREVTLHRPDGSSMRTPITRGVLEVTRTDLVGRWEAADGERRVTFAVNLLDPDVSDLDRAARGAAVAPDAGSGGVGHTAPGGATRTPHTPLDGSARAAAPDPGRVREAHVPLGRALVAAALLLLAVETWLLVRGSTGLPRAPAIRRGLTAVCLAVAVVVPEVTWRSAAEPVVVALDLSASAARFLGATTERVARLVRALPAGVPVTLIAFGARPSVIAGPASRDETVAALERLRLDPDRAVARAERDETDLAGALDLAGRLLGEHHDAALGAGGGRVVLATDGLETRGDARAGAAALAVRDIAVDVIAIGGPGSATARADAGAAGAEAAVVDLAIEDVEAPHQVLARVPFEIGARVVSTVDGEARVALLESGRALAERTIRVTRGSTPVRFTTEATRPGARGYAIHVVHAGDVVPQNDRDGVLVTVLGPPRIAWIGTAPHVAIPHGLDVVVIDMGGLDGPPKPPALGAPRGTRGAPRPPDDGPPMFSVVLTEWDAVVLADVDAASLPDGAIERLRRHVASDGLGLLMLGGPRGLALGGFHGTAIEEALPVDLGPRRTGRRDALGLVIALDRSGSMGEPFGPRRKIDAARAAALVAASLLGPGDHLGVLAFDAAAARVLPLGEPPSREALSRVLEALQPRGGTRLLPALAEARAMLAAHARGPRHVVLLTDGRGEGGDLERAARGLAAAGVTLSIVAVGDDADVALLATLARAGGGRFVHARDAARLDAALRREVALARGPLVQERVTRVIASPHVVLGGLAGGAIAPLAAYETTAAREGVAVPLRSDLGDPVLALGAYGAGRSAVLTSDLGGAWSPAWRGWTGSPDLLGRLLRWLARAPVAGTLAVTQETVEDRAVLAVRAEDASGGRLNGRRLVARLVSEDVEARRDAVEPRPTAVRLPDTIVPLGQVGPGRYVGTLAGRVTRPTRVVVDDVAGADRRVAGRGWIGAGYPDEYRMRPPNRMLLALLAGRTGGRLLDAAGDTIALRRMSSRAVVLWPWLTGAALVLFLVALAGATARARGR